MLRPDCLKTPLPSIPTNGGPLSGVRVLDLTRLLPGPMCAMYLADLGADVVKIEDMGAGDYAGPGLRQQVNRNKRGVRIDLKQPEGVATLLRLCESADVLIEGFRPGVMDRLGVGWEAVHNRNPRLVYASITGFGQTGPMRHTAGHDINYAALCGVAEQMGQPQSAPALSSVPVADLLGGSMPAAMGVLAALFDATRTGVGRHVDVAIMDGLMAHAVIANIGVQEQGRPLPLGQGTLTGALPCYGYYLTADQRWLAVGAIEKKFWDRFCACIGREDLKAKHPCAKQAERDYLRQEVEATINQRTLIEWAQVFEGEDCCVTPVLRLDEALEQPQVKARRMAVNIPEREGVLPRQLSAPVRMTDFEFSVYQLAPAPGEHTDEVLAGSGWCASEIQYLRSIGAIG